MQSQLNDLLLNCLKRFKVKSLPEQLLNLDLIQIRVNILPPFIITSYHLLKHMRFSSDDEIYDENSKNQQPDQSQDPKQTPLKKQKKQTMLSKFLDSLDPSTVKKLQNYEKLKRPVFERRPIVPQKISLYEDVLFILAFKDHRQNISSDGKQFKQICIDLESRTKRKQCTIKQRVQKKLCKMSPQQLLSHVANDKDISFNLKKILTSSAKMEYQKSSNKQGSQISNNTPGKEYSPSKCQNTDAQENEKSVVNSNDSPSKKSDLFEETQKSDKIQSTQQKRTQRHESQKDQGEKQVDETQITIIFKKESANETSFMMINRFLVQRQIKQLKRIQQQSKKKEQLLSTLKNQMNVIMQYRKKFSTIPSDVQMLIQEAKKIMKVLKIGSIDEIEKNGQGQNIIVEEKEVRNKGENDGRGEKMQQETPEIEKEEKEKGDEGQVGEFGTQQNLQEAIMNGTEHVRQQQQPQKQQQQTPQSQPQTQEQYGINFALCQNFEYIRLYYSNPQVFDALLWTRQQDKLIQRLIEDYQVNEGMLNMLIRYKGPQMFIERCIFMGRRIEQGRLLDKIKSYKPLNMGKLMNYMNEMKRKEEGEKQIVVE